MTKLFFVHGMWATPRIWDSYRSYFESLGYKTSAPALVQHFTRNQPVHVEGLSLNDYVDQLEEDYHQAAADGDDIVIIGHSMGGLLAQQLAMRVQPKAMILLASAPSSGLSSIHIGPLLTLSKSLMKPFFWKRGLKLSYSSARYGIFNALSEDEAKIQYERMCYDSGQALYELAFWYADPANKSAVNPSKIECPVMTLVGSEDRIVVPSIVKKVARFLGYPQHFHRLGGYGHVLQVEDKDFRVARQIHVWLCWQLGLESSSGSEASYEESDHQEGLNTATS